MTADDAIQVLREALVICQKELQHYDSHIGLDAANLALLVTAEFDGCAAVHFVRTGNNDWLEVEEDKVDYYKLKGYFHRVLYRSRRAACNHH